ncbi:hypothetical protein [Streptomyces werraensis]|uniref:hypothetical protein n=1 Tax=Streptomyces werraensis TaxID=68284 RepID=UPI0036B04B0E
MEHRTDEPTLEPTPRTPRPNRIVAEPATPQACAADYQAGADVRQAIARQDARTRR